MAYLRCEACGAKALSAASQCPRCAVPFDLIDARGFRAALKQCRGCGIMHRRDRHCHWCGEQPAHAWSSPRVVGAAAGMVILALAATGAYRYREPLADTAAQIVARVRTEQASASTARVQPAAGLQIASAMVTPSVAAPAHGPVTTDSSGAMLDASMAVAEGAASVSTPDSIVWTPAVARTWVNVRNDASRGGNVVGVINPSSRALLGSTRSGWRQVKSTDVTGWVDPRLFETDSTQTRGL